MGSHNGHLRASLPGRILATFNAPGQAIRCATAIRDSAAAHGIRPRTGIHTGEIDPADHTIAGIPLDITTTIAAHAAPGEILVSGTVRDLVVGSGITFAGRGAHALTSADDRRPLFTVTAT